MVKKKASGRRKRRTHWGRSFLPNDWYDLRGQVYDWGKN